MAGRADGLDVFEQYESTVRSYSRSFRAVFSTAQGARLFDENGRGFIDFLSGAGSLNYGHNNPKLKRAVLDYLERDGIVHSLDLGTTAKRDFINRFQSTILEPRGLDYKLQFTGPTGANGIEAGLKLARKATRRRNVVAFTGSYHGLSSGALAITADSFYSHELMAPRLDVSFLPFDGYDCRIDSLAYIRRVLSDKASGVDLPAAVVLETVQAEGGINVASIEWLRGVEALCHEHGIVLIVDDIQVGNGRTGTYFSFERAGIRPDIVVLSKSIGGLGLPLTLVLIKPSIDCWKPGEHTGTFRGNNLAFVAGSEAMMYWTDSKLAEHTVKLGSLVSRALESISLRYADVSVGYRGLGLIWGLELIDGAVAKAVRDAAFERGLIVELCGADSNVVKILPPLLVDEALLEEGLNLLNQAIGAVTSRANSVAAP